MLILYCAQHSANWCGLVTCRVVQWIDVVLFRYVEVYMTMTFRGEDGRPRGVLMIGRYLSSRVRPMRISGKAGLRLLSFVVNFGVVEISSGKLRRMLGACWSQ